MSDAKWSPEPWRQGAATRYCAKPEHAKGHPGPGGKSGCVYDRVTRYGRDDDYFGRYVTDADDETIIGGNDYGPILNDADARRIVACVNACAGIPTEALEAGALDVLLGAADWFARRPETGTAEDNADAAEDLRAALRSLGRLP